MSGALPANSVECTCGTYSWTTTLTASDSNKRLQLTIPDKTATATSEVICAAGDLSCKAREWSTGSSTVTEMTAGCWACDSASSTCTSAESAAALSGSGKGVARYTNTKDFTMKQDGTASTDVLKVKDLMYQPNSKNAVGRFYYKPFPTVSLYATYSTIAYTFGSQTFGTGAICQVFTSVGTAPGTVMSDYVKNCVISGSTVTLTMA